MTDTKAITEHQITLARNVLNDILKEVAFFLPSVDDGELLRNHLTEAADRIREIVA